VNGNHIPLDQAWIPDLPSLAPVSLSRDSVVVICGYIDKKAIFEQSKTAPYDQLVEYKPFCERFFHFGKLQDLREGGSTESGCIS